MRLPDDQRRAMFAKRKFYHGTAGFRGCVVGAEGLVPPTQQFNTHVGDEMRGPEFDEYVFLTSNPKLAKTHAERRARHWEDTEYGPIVYEVELEEEQVIPDTFDPIRYPDSFKYKGVISSDRLKKVKKFSRTESEIRKFITDLQSGLINLEDLPEEDLRDVDAYIQNSIESGEDLRKFRRTLGPSKVVRGTEYGSQYYTAYMRNKPVVKEYIVLALSTVMDEDDLKKFEATGKLDDSVISNAFRFYGETFGDGDSINRDTFVRQAKAVLSSVHGMSAVDLMIKKWEGNEI